MANSKTGQWPHFFVKPKVYLMLAGINRCLLLLNHENRMITLRHAPQLALIKTSIDADGSGVTVSAEGMPDITITPKAKVENSDQIVSFTIWSQATEGVVVGQGSSEWFSKYLGQEVRLVQHMPDFRMRGTEVETKGGKIFDKSIPIMYHDSGPVYLINDATIESANSLCQEPEFSWESFRPNIVVKGAAADAEESWSHVRINRITFKNVYISDKCAVTTVDKERGIKVDSRMDLLRKRRSATTDYERKNFGDKALFGISLAPHSRGLIEAGMTIDASMKS